MAITFGIAPNPHWVVIDDFSKLPPGAAIYTYDSANKSVEKPAYQAANINVPFTNPIVGFANGTFPPIYWAFNDALNPPDLYYIQVWDKVKGPNNVNGAVMLWDFDGLTGSNASGGGGTITTNIDLENLVINGEFYWNVGNQPIAPAISVDTLVTLAPSNHDGFCGVGISPANDGPPSPDIIFAKGDQSATDTLNFVDFPLGSNDFSPNPTPRQYVKYACTSPGSEAYKFIQFPIVKGLQNINNTNVSVQIWARYNGGNSNIVLRLRQFFGNGTNGPSSDIVTTIGSLNFNGSNWTQSIFSGITIPGIGFGGATLGNCGNDALFLQIGIPLSAAVDFDFILPALYLGDTTSTIDFHTQDFVDAIAQSPRTGDIRTSINSFSPYGWVPANDGTIGSAASGATTRNNIDTFPLYDLIWNSISNTLAPVVGGRGASSIADFGNNKAMFLTRNLGRVMAGALPVAASQAFTRNVNDLDVASSAGFYNGMAVITNVSGGLITAGVIYYAIIVSSTKIALATTTANALSGTKIVIGAALVGTLTSVNVETLGSYIGEERHALLNTELPAGPFAVQLDTTAFTLTPGGTAVDGVGPAGSGNQSSTNLRVTGGGNAFNVMQPTVFMNVFFKL